MTTDEFVLSYDTRPVRVGTLVRHCNSSENWRVRGIRYDGDGRASLSLVDPTNPNRFTAIYVDRTVVVDEDS